MDFLIRKYSLFWFNADFAQCLAILVACWTDQFLTFGICLNLIAVILVFIIMVNNLFIWFWYHVEHYRTFSDMLNKMFLKTSLSNELVKSSGIMSDKLVPKPEKIMARALLTFGTMLNKLVPKQNCQELRLWITFGTMLNKLVPKQCAKRCK